MLPGAHEGWLMSLVPWLEYMAQGRGNREREYTENDPVYFTSWDHSDFILPMLQMAKLDMERWSLLSRVPWTLDGTDYDDPSATPPYSAETFYSFGVYICPFPKWKSKHLLSRSQILNTWHTLIHCINEANETKDWRKWMSLLIKDHKDPGGKLSW